jgi:hypothetical protein
VGVGSYHYIEIKESYMWNAVTAETERDLIHFIGI